MLEIARAFTKASRPFRTLAFLAETAEPEGLLGMQYYLEDPNFFADRLRAVIHIAGFSPFGFQREIRVIGQPFAALKDLLITKLLDPSPEFEPDSKMVVWDIVVYKG